MKHPVSPAAPDLLEPPATIIDYLSADPQYSYFLRHIQRLGLVPTINQMANVTLFAPVNLAFVDSELTAGDSAANLLRYFAAQRFRVSYILGTTAVLDSLYETKRSGDGAHFFPLKVGASDARESGPYMVNDIAEILEYDGYAKHQHSFIQTIDHLLPLAVSMCSLLMDPSAETHVVNGHSIRFVKLVFQLAFATEKHGPAPISCDDFLANVSTVLVPTDRYIESSLLDMEKRYYLTLHHGLKNPDLYPTKEAVREMKTDYLSFLLNLLLPDLVGGVNGTSLSQLHSSTWGQNSYNISFDPNTSLVRLNNKIWSAANSTALTLSDGLLHIFDLDSKDPTQAVDFVDACNIDRVAMIPRKTLFAMHFSNLVRELRFYKKAHLIDESAMNQTILVDASDRDDFFDEDYVSSIHLNRQQMLYKFIDGFVDMNHLLSPESPRFHALLNSKLCLKKRINSCFRVKVSGTLESDGTRIVFNDRFEAGSPFIALGNNSIYVLETDFAVPASFKNVVAQLISDGTTRENLDHVTVDKSSCLQTLKYFEEFDLLLLKDNHKGYTVFLPCGRPIWDGNERSRNKRFVSWDSLGLILKYLEKNPNLFQTVLQDNFFEDMIYSDFGLEDSRESSRLVTTLNGNSVNISELYHEGDYNHIIRVNETAISIPLNSDVLFLQGVIHITQKVLLPADFLVSLKDLINAEHDSSLDTSSFAGLIDEFPRLANLVLLDNPTGSEFSIMAPTSELLREYNITRDYKRLLEFLELHLISNSEADILLKCMGVPFFESRNLSYTIQTSKANGAFTCHTNPLSGKTFLSLPQKLDVYSAFTTAVNHKVRVMNYGCSQQGTANSSCVFLLDRPLDVAWFDIPDNFLHVHIGWISVGIGIVIGVILFGFFTTTIVLCLSKTGKKKDQAPELEGSYKPAGSGYMPITSNEDPLAANFDHGYETDVDLMRSETDQLLPKNGERRPGSVRGLSPAGGVPSAPLKIKKQGILETINRERNLPPLMV
ncbi:hypothetical protein METBIDRAFT_46441 [Metschnikowia bicuspidata var. bicuspidata NRRL YB-4993]|uniref:FAS1 domain-containing protein n=1 Tax=Metschnikowia bicuspidata var. bicuspidata NRRL YB-4993 TaxID=869754 RepID=A0A1A0H551_9ASCO|nr:hypothetical protein METBIDRAFT_46441 [Metschnikowia bicuspidata var. bicuspidata NRRL YB-4993]OBA19166.1 hypothetical protein METBIDRAFT_46441 [Metschnikowia bicuspidata var. bicuspidata NRRL YB-4993]